MSNNANSETSLFSNNMIDAAIKIFAIIAIGSWCFDIIKPFVLPMAWGAIIATALYPFYLKMVGWFFNKKGLAAAVFALVGISILVVPTFIFSSSAIDSITLVSERLQEGTLVIPHPDKSVQDWPLIGEKTYSAWDSASNNLENFASQYSEQIKNTFSTLLGAVASFGGVILQFIFSMIIAAMFLTNADSCIQGCKSFFARLLGDKSDVVLKNTVATVRSVGVAVSEDMGLDVDPRSRIE